MTGSFETARFLLAMAQEGAQQHAAAANVPIVTECGLAEEEDDEGKRSYVVTVRYRIPFAIADQAAADDTTR